MKRPICTSSTALIPLAGLLWLAACDGSDDSPFGNGGNNNNGVPGDGGSAGDGGSDGGDDTGDGGGADGGGTDGGGTDGGGTDGGGADGGDTGLLIEGTGYAVGDTAYDLTGTSSPSGFSLHDLYEGRVLLVAGHMDDTGLQGMVGWMGELTGVRTVLLVGRDEDGIAADAADASRLASTHGIDWVVIDPTGKLVNQWAERAPPKSYLIDVDMQIFWTFFGTTAQTQVEDKIDDMGG